MRRLGLLLGAAFLFAGGALLARGRFMRVAVSGHSMEPTLRDGDWLIVGPGRARTATIVVCRDPREPSRLIVKRVRSVGADSQLVLESDHPAHASETIAPVAARDVVGRVVLRYWPPRGRPRPRPRPRTVI
jgi:phage repressor protein C with HTH and peptisase S24 domain